MDDFHRLLALTRAAEACNGNARTFIRRFSKVLPYSRDSCAAQRQVSVKWHRAQGLAMLLEGAMEAWEEHSDVLDYIGKAVGVSAPPLFVDGLSYQTAHEAAYYLADAVLTRFRDSGGDDDIDACRDLANRLADFGGLPDLYGRIQGESFAGRVLVPTEPDVEAPLLADGPVVGERWRLDGAIIQETLAPMAWRLVNHLFHATDNSASYEELAPIVADDHAESILDSSTCRGHRDKANEYFRRHDIPWKVSLRGQPTLKPARSAPKKCRSDAVAMPLTS